MIPLRTAKITAKMTERMMKAGMAASAHLIINTHMDPIGILKSATTTWRGSFAEVTLTVGGGVYGDEDRSEMKEGMARSLAP